MCGRSFVTDFSRLLFHRSSMIYQVFPFIVEYCSIVWSYHIVFIHLSAEGLAFSLFGYYSTGFCVDIYFLAIVV